MTRRAKQPSPYMTVKHSRTTNCSSEGDSTGVATQKIVVLNNEVSHSTVRPSVGSRRHVTHKAATPIVAGFEPSPIAISTPPQFI